MVKEFQISEQRKQVWKIELELAKELERVCKKHNIKYFADAGTILGAIRHSGFIPWDDDMDFIMLREDYDRFLKVASKEFKKPFFLQSAYSDAHYFRGHAQLRMDGTTAIAKFELGNVDFHQGIFIDIFPFDYVSKSKMLNKAHSARLRCLMKIMKNQCSTHPPSSKLMGAIRAVVKKLSPNKKKSFKKFEKIARHAPRTDKNVVDATTFLLNEKRYRYLPKRYFSEVKYVKFENIKIPIPIGAHEIMEKYYGKDYMTPKQASTVHGDVLFSTDRDYREVIEEVRKTKNTEKYEI